MSIARCGNCSNQVMYNGSDVCDLPTPAKYSACYQQVVNAGTECQPGYITSCNYTINSQPTMLCCPDIQVSDNIFDINCSGGGDSCSINISFQNRSLECSTASSILDCLNNPDATYVNGVKSEFPIKWIIYPKEMYDGILQQVASPCGASDDYSCLPYSERIVSSSVIPSNAPCLSGESVNNNCLFSSVGVNSTEQSMFCQFACPSYQDQLSIGVTNPCGPSYYDLCTISGCGNSIDQTCLNMWTKQQITNGQLMPNRLPTVVSVASVAGSE